MVKGKISTAAATTEKKGKSKDTSTPVEKVGKKHRKNGGVLKYKTHLKRLCKTLEIPQLNKDALAIVNNAIDSFLSNIIKNLIVMYSNTNKMLTTKAVKLAFITQMERQGVSSDLYKPALDRVDKALETVKASFPE